MFSLCLRKVTVHIPGHIAGIPGIRPPDAYFESGKAGVFLGALDVPDSVVPRMSPPEPEPDLAESHVQVVM